MNWIKHTKPFLFLFFISFSFVANASEVVRLATTTSTYHSGLLDFLLPVFQKDSGYEVQILAAGTGKALKMGENCDVDLIMSHAPHAEAKFVKNGFGILPRRIMYNDFVLVGPKHDPAKIHNEKNVLAALKKIAIQDVKFISRGDDSGTHKKELELWREANVSPEFSAYKVIGQGMGPTLIMANELQAYTLTDRGTWLAYQDRLGIQLLLEADKRLFNPYHVILVNPDRHPKINRDGAKALSDWLVSPKGQSLINDFKVSGFQLFIADLD